MERNPCGRTPPDRPRGNYPEQSVGPPWRWPIPPASGSPRGLSYIFVWRGRIPPAPSGTPRSFHLPGDAGCGKWQRHRVNLRGSPTWPAPPAADSHRKEPGAGPEADKVR